MAKSISNPLNLTPRNTLWGRPPAGDRIQQARTVTDIPIVRLPDALSTQPLRDMFEAWSRAVDAEGISPPSRAHFQPQNVKSTLGRVMIADREEMQTCDKSGGPGWTYRYRLVGTEIVKTFGQDFTGETVEIFHPPLRAMAREQFDAAFVTLEPVAVRICSVVDYLAYDYEKLVLPVRSAAGGSVDQAVVATFQINTQNPR
jgi:hypothetical protein